MNNKNGIIIKNIGFNKEYTASNQRILHETGKEVKIISIDEGIDKLIHWEKKRNEKTCC